MGFYWIFPGISQFGKCNNTHSWDRRNKNISSNGIFMTPVIPSSGIPNAVVLFSQFFPIAGISLSQLFHNNGILLSQIYLYDGILLSLNFPIPGFFCPKLSRIVGIHCLYWDFQTVNIPNSGKFLSPNFPKTRILLSQNCPNSGIFIVSYFPKY